MRLGNDIVDRPTRVIVVSATGEAPRIGRVITGTGVCRAAEVQRSAKGRAAGVDARHRAGGRVRMGVICDAVGRNYDKCGRFVNDDGDTAALIGVVGAARECPVGYTAWDVDETGAQVQGRT